MTIDIDTLRRLVREEYDAAIAEDSRRSNDSFAEWKVQFKAGKQLRTAQEIAHRRLLEHPRDKWEEIINKAIKLATIWINEKQRLGITDETD